MPTVATLKIIIGADTKPANDGLQQTDDKLKGVGEQAKRTGSSLRDHLHVNLADVARVALDVAGQALNVGTSYEDATNLIAAQSSEAATSIDQFRASAKALGADQNLVGTSAGDAAQAMLEMQRAGLSVQDTLDGARGVLQLAAAGELANAEAAQVAAAALNAFGLEGDKVGQVADRLAAASSNSSAEVTDMAASFTQAAGVYGQYQLSSRGAEGAMDDLSTALTILANKGIVGSDAGTAMAATMRMLAAPTEQARTQMDAMAQSLEISGSIAYDASGQMRPFEEIVRLISDATDGMTEAQRNATLTTMLGADGLKAMLPILAEGADGFAEMRDKITQAGTAQTLAEARAQGLSGATQNLQSATETLLLNSLEPMLPVLAQGVQGMADFALVLSDKAGPAATALAEGVTALFDFLDGNGLPILAAATTGGIAYAASMSATLIPAIQASVVAFAAQAAAIAAAAAPIAVVAVAAAGLAKIYQEYNQGAEGNAQAQLAHREAWIASGQALEDYAALSPQVQAALADEKAALEASRTALYDRLVEANKKAILGQNVDEEITAIRSQLAALDEQAAGLRQSANAYTITEDRAERTTGSLYALADGAQSAGTAALLTAEQQARLNQELESTASAGGDALAALAASEAQYAQQSAEAAADYAASRAEATESYRRDQLERESAYRETLATNEQQYQASLADLDTQAADARAARAADLADTLSDLAAQSADATATRALNLADALSDLETQASAESLDRATQTAQAIADLDTQTAQDRLDRAQSLQAQLAALEAGQAQGAADRALDAARGLEDIDRALGQKRADEQEQADRKRADISTDYEQRLADLQADAANATTDAQRARLDAQIADAQAAYERKLADLETTLQRETSDAEEAANRKREALAIQQQREEEDARIAAERKRAALEAKAAEEEADAQAAYTRKKALIEQQAAEEEAAEAAKIAKKKTALQQAASEDAAEAQAQYAKKRALIEQQAAEEESREAAKIAKRRTEIQVNYAAELEDAQAQYAKQNAQAAQAEAERAAQAEQSYQRSRARAAQSYADEQADLREHLGTVMREYLATEQALGRVTPEQATQANALITETYGVDSRTAAQQAFGGIMSQVLGLGGTTTNTTNAPTVNISVGGSVVSEQELTEVVRQGLEEYSRRNNGLGFPT